MPVDVLNNGQSGTERGTEMLIQFKDSEETGRTKREIANALMRLLEDTSYSDITVRQLMEESGYSRGTFYINFKSKEEVLRCLAELMNGEYTRQLKNFKVESLNDLICFYFFFWRQNRELINVIKRDHLFAFFMQKYDEWCISVPDEYSFDRMIGISLSTSKERVFFHAYQATGLWTILNVWAGTGMEETPEELAKMYLDFFTNGKGIVRGTDESVI